MKKPPTLQITKELFVETINAIKKQQEHDDKCHDAFSIILPDDYVSGYDNHVLANQLTKLLKLSMNDNHEDSWIEYFIWDLEFGDKYKEGCAMYKDDTNINLSDAENLYDFLVGELNNN